MDAELNASIIESQSRVSDILSVRSEITFLNRQKDFLEYFDGFSIGSNDLTQLTLGLDRDSGMPLLAADFDERDPAVKILLLKAIEACQKHNKYVGICGQGPSDHLDFAKWLVDKGIESISLNPDSVISTWNALAA
jgi:pyruvate,water dikinase